MHRAVRAALLACTIAGAGLAFAASPPDAALSDLPSADELGDAPEVPAGTLVKPIPPIPSGPPATGAMPADVLAAALAARDLPLAERMKAVSDPMVGKPYAIDPLGEGAGIDPDPLARYDAFDCLTLVEEVMALAYAGDPVHAAEIRKRIRYGDGPVEYAHRRHMMELQWIPGNVADGFLVDTTKSYGETVRQERDITVDSWSRWRRRKLFALTDEQLPVGKMALDVLPLEAAIAAAESIEPGSLVLTVRAEMGVPLWTTHIGFVVPGEGEVRMRNASRRSAMRVLDERLGWYLKHLQSYTRRPVSGIVVLEPVEQAPRRAAVAPVAARE